MGSPDRRKRLRGSAIAAAMAICAALGGSARAGETSPVLAIYRAKATDTASGTLVRIEGTFPWNAVIQSAFPIKLVVWKTVGSTEFVRFDLDGSAYRGTNPSLADGLGPNEVVPLLNLGQIDPVQSLTHVDQGYLEVVLGSEFQGAPLGAQLFVVDRGVPFVSNPIAVSRGAP